MTGRVATVPSRGFHGRQKRKRAPDISTLEACSPDLVSLHEAISKGVETLDQLTCAIEDADTDEAEPVAEAVATRFDGKPFADVPAEPACEKVPPSCSYV